MRNTRLGSAIDCFAESGDCVLEPPSVDPVTGLNSPSTKHNRVVVVRTALVAQIEFTEWMPGGHLRHSKFVGLREDKAAREVGREGKAAKQSQCLTPNSQLRLS
jgi:ATP-dependent DNA ligase